MNSSARYLSIIVLVLVALILKELSFIFIPLTIAVFLTALLVPVFDFFKHRNLPLFIPVSVVFVGVFVLSVAINFVIQETSKDVIAKEEILISNAKEKLHPLLLKFDDITGIDLSDIKWNAFVKNQNASIVKSVSPVLESLNSLAGMYILLILFLFFLLSGVYSYEQFFLKIGSKEHPKLYLNIFKTWVDRLKTYIIVKFWISVITGILFGVTCYSFGLEFALFFGVLAFLLNFIPQVGSLVATLLPTLFGFIMLDNYITLIVLFILLFAIQFVMGNIVEVKYLGKSFDVSPIIIFVNLLFWGYLWGIAGILLSMPILILIKVVSTHLAKDGFLAKLLS